MIDGNDIVQNVGSATGKDAVLIVLQQLSKSFEAYADELRDMFDDGLSHGFDYAAGWCEMWSLDIESPDV